MMTDNWVIENVFAWPKMSIFGKNFEKMYPFSQSQLIFELKLFFSNSVDMKFYFSK